MRFLQRVRNARHVPDSEHDRVGVEAAVAEGQRLGVLDLPLQPLEAAFLGPLLADREHVRVDVGHGHLRTLADHAEGDVSGAAGHVEDMLAGARFHPGDEAVLPQPVKAARHDVVHHVVAARDGTEDLADAAGLLFRADELLAEIDLGGRL